MVLSHRTDGLSFFFFFYVVLVLVVLLVIVISSIKEYSTRAMATTQQDRFNVNTQSDHVAAKYVGTGHADTNRFEWALNIKRDTYASIVANHSLAAHQSIGEYESIGRITYQMKQSMLVPCGTAPKALMGDNDEDDNTNQDHREGGARDES